MGSLTFWDMSSEFVEQFPVFIETGYGTGSGLEYAVKHDFKRILSIEIWYEAINHGREKFRSEDRVDIVDGDSASAIPLILGHEDRAAFFWLDAHFPGADCFNQPFDAAPMAMRLPLDRELAAIRSCRPQGNYTILVDDLHCWADLPWELGSPWDLIDKVMPADRSLSFLEPFCATHDVQIFLNGKGYALISPRGAPMLRYAGDRETK